MSTTNGPPRLRMLIPSETHGDELYELELWPTSKALEWQHRLLQLGLEPAAMLMDEGDPNEMGKFGMVARTLTSKLETNKLDALLTGLLGSVYLVGDHEGKPTVQRVTDKGLWEHHFRGRLMLVHRLAWWVLEENFADFIGAARSFVEALQKLWQSVSRAKPDDAQSGSVAAVVDVTATPSSP